MQYCICCIPDFYTKFLCDIGVIDFDEPFKKLFNQGMITGKNGIKMSKSKGNVVSPDDLVRDYGCDSLRMYELFVGPPELDAEWDDRGIEGVSRFLNRFWTPGSWTARTKTSPSHQGNGQDCAIRLVYDIEQPFRTVQPEYRCLRLHGVQQQAHRSWRRKRAASTKRP